MAKEKLNFYHMFWLFIWGSVFGWVLEVIYSLITQGIFINHSALVIGPFDLAYGLCACSLTFLLYRYRECSYYKLFLIGFIGGSILEYIMSWGMELVVGFSAWDYSDNFLNINGRICFSMSVLWGLLGIFWIKYIYPFAAHTINKLDKQLGNKLMIVLIFFLLFDLGLTIYAVIRAKANEKGIQPANFIEKCLDHTFNKEFLTNMYNNHWGD